MNIALFLVLMAGPIISAVITATCREDRREAGLIVAPHRVRPNWGLGLGLGVAIGTALSVSLDNWSFVAIGIGLGVAFAYSFGERDDKGDS
jgi:hypothetical protein